MDIDQSSSWDEYQRALEQIQNKRLYGLLPGPLRSLVYGDAVTKIEESDERRASTVEKFEAFRERTRSLIDDTAEHIRGPRRRGEPLPDASDRLRTFRDNKAEIEGLLADRARFLSTAEQSTLRELQTQLTDIETQLATKHEFDSEVAEIKASINELETEIEANLDDKTLLSEDIEADLLDRLDAIQRWIDTVPEDINTNQLTDPDRSRLDGLADTVHSLRERTAGYNEQLVESQAETVRAEATVTVNRLDEALDGPRTEGDALPQPVDEYRDDIDPLLNQTNELLETRKAVYLDSEDADELVALQTSLADHRAFLRAKSRFDVGMSTLSVELAELQETVEEALDFQTYLTTPSRSELTARCEAVRDQVSDIVSKIDVEYLATADREAVDGVTATLEDLHSQIADYNDAFVEQKCDEYKAVFSGFGEDNLSLNPDQEAAVYRNDIHNQVIAGAGTGKTFSLACRVKYLIEEGVGKDEILSLTFTRKAADEMGKRLNEMFGISGVETATLHSFGKHVLREVDPSLVQLEGQTRLREVGRLIRELRESNPAFQNHYEQFLEHYEDENLEEDKKRRQDFVESLKYKSDTTLCGEEVDSVYGEEQEVHTSIADFLFKRDIRYRYRQYASWAENPGQEAYIPDFTLPGYNIYIEYLPSQEIREQKRWYERKRSSSELEAIFAGTDKTLITICGDEIQTNRVQAIVKEKLSHRGVSIGSPQGEQARVDVAYEHNIMWRDVESAFADFVKKAKTNQIDPTTHLDEVDESADPELFHFSHAATRLLSAYTDRYEAHNAYDFVDMIVRATDAIERGMVDDVAQFRHVMVDEFQDLNLVQIAFVQALLSRHDDARLFAVGDDWQSIYGFKGARPGYFIDFADHFTPALETRLETNYRCPPQVVKAGNTLMQYNEAKTDKTVTAFKDLEAVPCVHLVPGTDDFQYRRNAIRRIVKLVTESVRDAGRDPSEVMVLARNQEGSPFIREISKRLRDREIPVGSPNGVQVITAHKAKGKEAKHVIIANAAEGLNDSFPPEEQDRNLTDLVEVNTGSHMDEKRRLFYVALTRAEEQLDIQSRAMQQSPFLDEIQSHIIEDATWIDCTQDRTSTIVTVDDAREAEPYWETRQIGEVVAEDEYTLNFAVLDDATDTQLLTEGAEYKLSNVKIGDYDGQPQLQIDAATDVIPQSSTSWMD